MKKQLLVLVLACSAIGSAYSAGGDKGKGKGVLAKLNDYRIQYARPTLLIKGITKTTLGAFSALAAWKDLTKGTGDWHPFDHDFHFSLRHLLIADSLYFIPSGIRDMCNSTFGCKSHTNAQQGHYTKVDKIANPDDWKLD